MVIEAKIKCKFCGKEFVVSKKTSRAFMIKFNKIRQHHDESCEYKLRREKNIASVKLISDDAIKKMMDVKH